MREQFIFFWAPGSFFPSKCFFGASPVFDVAASENPLAAIRSCEFVMNVIVHYSTCCNSYPT